METLTPAAACRISSIRVTTTRPTEFIDVTDRLEELVGQAGIRTGIVNVQTRHTTTGVVVNEHEPLLLSDFEALLNAAAPDHGCYRHDDTAARTVNVEGEERANGHAHCRALFLPTSVCLAVVKGSLLLGRWQRVFLVELDGPRTRELSVLVLGESER